MLTPNQKGAIAEAAIAYEAICAGAEVYKPLSEHSRCDLVFEIGGKLFRVQCKTARRVGEVVSVNLATSRHTPNGYVRTRYTAEEVDLFAAHCHELGATYLIPFDDCDTGKSGIQLRLSPTLNGQRAAVHFAADYLLSGAVAQLARAPAWHAGGRRFESDQLHHSSEHPSAAVVGANEFRNLFGHFMERAAAGEEIAVTRRGKPYVRLVPGQPPLS